MHAILKHPMSSGGDTLRKYLRDKQFSRGAGVGGGGGVGRGGKCVLFKKIVILNAVIFYLKRQEDFGYCSIGIRFYALI